MINKGYKMKKMILGSAILLLALQFTACSKSKEEMALDAAAEAAKCLEDNPFNPRCYELSAKAVKLSQDL